MIFFLRYIRITVLMLCFMIAPAALYAQFLTFSHLNVENGLSQSTVLAITQDSRGFIWFGTRDGLNRYDTREFRVYRNKPGDKASISSSYYIIALLEDSRKRLWIGTNHGLNRYIPESDSFEPILKDSVNTHNPKDKITCIYEDSDKNIWVGTGNGLNRLTANNKLEEYYPAGGGKIAAPENFINTIYQDKSGVLWIGTSKGLKILERTPKGYSFRSFLHSAADPGSISGNEITTIAEDRQGNLWVGTKNAGLNIFDRKTGNFLHVKYQPGNTKSLSSDVIRKIVVDKNTGHLWVATINGLNYLDPVNKSVVCYKNDSENPNSLSNNSIHDIYQDKNGVLWIGTMYAGVDIAYPDATPFEYFQHSTYKNSISGNVISCIIEDDQHNLWIGTEGDGLNYYNIKTGKFTHFSYNQDALGLGSGLVKTVYMDRRGDVWVGLHEGGLFRYNKPANAFSRVVLSSAGADKISQNIYCILEDHQGQLWIGTGTEGLYLVDRNTMQVIRHFSANAPEKADRISDDYTRVIFEDSKHNIWLGTSSGLNLLPAGANGFVQYMADAKAATQLYADYINCITEDSKGRIWIGTYRGGLSLYHPRQRDFTTFTPQNGLPSDNILGIVEDDAGLLWIGTDKGLSRFDPVKKTVRTYNVRDGLPGMEFHYNAALKTSSGRLYLGNYNGLVSFIPAQIKEYNLSSPLVFTGLKLFNRPVTIGDNSNLLRQDISYTQKLTFTHNQNVFTLNFATLNYIRSAKNQYAYKLEGFDKDWNYTTNPEVTYTNLPAGRYQFKIKNSTNGLDNGRYNSIAIEVLPAPWKTWWAYVLYAMTIGTILYFVIRFLRGQARLERELYYEHLENVRQKEMHQMKLDFFTNISHEIRTPLTLILGPLEKLLSDTVNHLSLYTQVKLVKNNADRLMRLINELLDFRKADTGNLKLSKSPTNLIAFSRDIFVSFEPMAQSRNIRYEFVCDTDRIDVAIDRLQMEKVVFNLLSNAFKFTPDNEHITCLIRVNNNQVELKVSDNGRGIPYADQDKIFTSYYQAGNQNMTIGTGIGLALTRTIVQLHEGTITFESIPAQPHSPGRTCFTVCLPLQEINIRDDYSDDGFPVTNTVDEAYPASQQLTATDPAVATHHILLVEDNEEVRQFIRESLSENYIIHECVNGLQGWQTAVELIPDLIISDVMMPEMDGIALSSKLKTDERTSHIPIILLTAKAAHTHQVSGLETGADVYITKPFSIKLLELNIRNLIRYREIMRDKFSQQVTLQPKNIVLESPDEKFLEKLMNIIETHMADPEFNVAALVSKIGMSQTVLYRKIKALTGLPITDFIKSVRLKQAAQLLSQHKLNISEVAYAVGFNDRKYFSKEFRKQFGKAPSEFSVERLGQE
ncbi:response regulator [Pedobacter sp. BS3]|uniref:hybrid sensor histidine kinase/response regulator transcription factor n=1 Tax=Pedobacter sp. BS3 TaxID=2567937 RepID=UPI0011ED8FDF|nr:hybrid sensor histidine kinase/response regulator transcription factor [Pedobacter sp. BS3]TZF82782.1 response regulator [Pedobacter sp. BS3]